MTPKIVFLDQSTLSASLRKIGLPHRFESFSSSAEEEVVRKLAGATVAISNKVPLREDSLQHLPDLKMIAVAATGTNNVDLAYCKKRGIVVSNIRDYAVDAVPEHVFCLVLALRRNLPAYRRDIALWKNSTQFCLHTHPIADIAGSTFGIIGFGALGRAVAKLAEAFGCHVLVSERKGELYCREGYTPFEEVIGKSDIISIHCLLNETTRNLISAKELGAMKPNAILINTARGGIVDESALAAALAAGKIAGAGFDVLSAEPPTAGNPLLDIHSDNFILTPHIAWASESAMQKLADQLIGNIEAFLRGNPQNRVA